MAASTSTPTAQMGSVEDLGASELPDDGWGDDPAVPEALEQPQSTNSKKPTSVDCWSMSVDAFVLNTKIFNDHHFIAPLNRPDNAAFLPGIFSAPDAIPFVDVDGASPWYRNSRIADITKTPEEKNGVKNYDNMVREGRLGIYVHWCLPQRFRSGKAADTDDKTAGEINRYHIPDRWIVFRCITDAAEKEAPALSAFIVESNRIRHFGGSIDEHFDVETEASPFIDKTVPVEKQIDVFMGMKRNFDDDWDDPEPEGKYHTPLTLLDSANPLFADFQHHNSNVFSIHDDMTWKDAQGNLVHSHAATVSYAIFGYHSQHSEDRVVIHGSLYNVEWKRSAAPPSSEAIDIAKNVNKAQPIALGSDALEALEAYMFNLPGNEDWIGLIDEMKLAIGQSGHGGFLGAIIPQNIRAGFKPSDGGRCWRFNNDAVGSADKPDGHKSKAHVPSASEMTTLLKTNRHQTYVDALERQEHYLRHRLFCEWWNRRSRVLGGKWKSPRCQQEGDDRLARDIASLERVVKLRSTYTQASVAADLGTVHATARSEFFSKADPSIILGGLGTTWPAEFLTMKNWQPRKLEDLPFAGERGTAVVQNWLKEISSPDTSGAAGQGCMDRGMKHFFQNSSHVEKILPKVKKENKALMKLPDVFKTLQGMSALNFTAPGWVRVTIDALMQEWAYGMSIGDPETRLPAPRPAYYTVDDTHWGNTQPCRALFLEWELEYYHLPKRFWRLERNSDGTADYKILPGINISSFELMESHRRTAAGRSILRPNAEWPLTTLSQQLLDKLDPSVLEGKAHLAAGGKDGIQQSLESALKALRLVSGSLEGLTDHLLTLHGGLHISPYESKTNLPKTDMDKALLEALTASGDGFDVTPYGEDAFSIDRAERDFKPVTHGQARFTRFNIVDKFGQVISPIHNPASKDTKPLYPCLGRSVACQLNESEGGKFANSVNLDHDSCSQFFQLGHRINQDARLNTYFAVNSADHKNHHETTHYFKGDRDLGRGQVEHSWRPTTEYEDPVWGWLMLDFRSMAIQVYNAAGESMGEAIVPHSIHGKAYWQVYYAEGDMAEHVDENSQLQQFMKRMSDAKFLIGLWTMLVDACQNIYHDPASGDVQMLNMVGRPLALVNIGINIELATPPMRTQSYQDMLKKEELHLEEYKFEVLLGDKANLQDGLVGYFSHTAAGTDPCAKRPYANTVYTEFGYPGRTVIDGEHQKPDSFGSPSTGRVYVSPMHVDPSEYNGDLAGYQNALNNHPSTVILGAIVDPYMPINIATGILPSRTLKLPQWAVDQTLKKLRILLRGGPVLTRGDLPGIDAVREPWVPPMNDIKAEAYLSALTDKGEWSWLQPSVSAYAEQGGDDELLPRFVPYNLKEAPSDYPMQMGPHTVVEGFYKYNLLQMNADGRLLAGKPPRDD
ncbi:hypothetical protein HJFPF1_08423 [Paramyrothecium foliicola]|nr:hypothetical protein HJFPF1_08423 [Paramyrothecium foliicola]